MNRLTRKQVYLALVALIIVSIPSFALAREAASNQTSLLTATELEGGAVAYTPSRTLRRGSVNSAMLAAIETDQQLRRIDLFLKSPAQSSVLRVVQSSHPDPVQK